MRPMTSAPSPGSTLAGLPVRAALASPFLASGILKLSDWPAAVAEFVALGLWWPKAAVAAAIATQLIGSLLLLRARTARAGAAVLAGFTAIATLLAHPFWNVEGPDRARQLTTFLEHAALIGGLAAAAIPAGRRPPEVQATS